MDTEAIVVGGGHAGIEAALALARLQVKTVLITQSLDSIGRLSCNPAVGGLSKGNIVREIDALGGQMARLIDETMIQFRMLNRSRGPAVQAPRAQADKFAYAQLAKCTLEHQENLTLFQDTVTDIILDKNGTKVEGVITERGLGISAKTVVVTTGTFMEGKIFIGEYTCSSGRLGEPAAVGLGTAFRRLGFSVGRLKTGTPARVAASSLDFDRMEEQKGEAVALPFSFFSDGIHRPNISCYITYTNEATHDIIRENMHRSPLYGGAIVGKGPRYCPSIEDKVVRFPDRKRHQIFVEPEGEKTEEMYLNGISSSLPEEVQERFLRTVPGLEQVRVMRPGYAVEYDYLDPRQLTVSLETKRLRGLFTAGQTNGTSGYEEAGCQGLLAGINAACYLRKTPPLVLTRAEAYTGVLIDDLVTLGTNEPYRMFTSRAEYRLCLRHDNADMRLFEKGYRIGLHDDPEYQRFLTKSRGIDEIKELLTQRTAKQKALTEDSKLHRHVGKHLAQILKDPEVAIEDFFILEPDLSSYPQEWLRQSELDVKYEGYIKRQLQQVERFHRMEKVAIPQGFNFETVAGLSHEAREKLSMVNPVSVGQASRISGVRSSDIALLLVTLGRNRGR